MSQIRVRFVAAVLFALPGILHAEPMGTAFTYQGKIVQSGTNVAGACDFRFGLWDTPAGGSEVATAVDVANVSVTDGSFAVELDFGAGVFNGDKAWLEIGIACPGGGELTTLAPRQALTPSPASLFAATAGTVEWLNVLNVPPSFADGDDVVDADADPANELQSLSLITNQLGISSGNSVDLSGYLDDTDDQTLAEVLAQGEDAGGGSVSNLGAIQVGTIDADGTITGFSGFDVGNLSGDGLFVHHAGTYGSSGISGLANGVEVRSAENDGLMVGANGGDGVDIWNAGLNGLHIRGAGNHGLHILNASVNGIDIDTVGNYAINAATGINYFAGDTGIGVSPPTHRLHVVDAVSGAASTANHVALIENNTTGNSADVLVIKMPEIGSDIDVGNNYISFHDGGGNSIGAIQGNGAGSVSYAGAGNDYAEYLPRLDAAELILPGELVGVHAGRVSKRTAGADQVLVASTGAIVAGNDPGEGDRDAYTLVAFLGQADLQVRGPVLAGDLIVASGHDDGVGVAVSAELMDARLFEQVVGQAWEANPDPETKPVRSLIGLVQRSALSSILRRQEARLSAIEQALGMR